MGLDVVGPGTGFLPTSDDMNELYFMLQTEREALNRTVGEVRDLFNQLDSDAYTELWVARDDEGIACGFAALHLGRKKSDGHTASLRLLVAKDMRVRGLGTRLVNEALMWADENGITRITATPYARPDGELVPEFFRKFDFRLEGFSIKGAKRGDEYVNVLQLARIK